MPDINQAHNDAQRQWQQFKREQTLNPDLTPYVGPTDLLNRFLAGEIITAEQATTDESPWVIRALHHAQRRRLDWMLDRA